MILNRIKIINSVNLETFTIKKKERALFSYDGWERRVYDS